VSDDDRGNPRLLRRIGDLIRSEGPLSFERFMDLALHDPADGYYAAGAARLGTEGDFYTAADVGRAFGRCVARQLVEMDALLGEPRPFTAVEHGAGRGRLARDLLDVLPTAGPGLSQRLQAVLVDRSAAMRDAARAAVPEAAVVEPERAPSGYVGCALAVELFDALPVRRLRRRDGELREVFVDSDDSGELIELEGTPSDDTLALAERYGAAPEEGDEAEVCPALHAVLARIVSGLGRGFLIVVDYGHAAPELYGPRHRRGTLLAYHRHQTSEAYLSRVGHQDLTAHVNFTALEDGARRLGLRVLGRTTQDRFLLANGIAEEFDAPDEAAHRDPSRVKRRLQALQLIHPEAMGRRFQVLIAAKGIEPAPTLAGLRDPFARP
jgi:SAM-dependent MidA family methyltransferase